MTTREPAGPLLCGGLVMAILLMRMFDVAESADQGDTLWIAGLWFVAWLIWSVVAWKLSLPVVPLGWLDLSVGSLVVGHILSALAVVVTTGDKRAAINLAWEWLGVAIGWFLLRQQCQRASFRNELLAGLLATGTSIAGLGLFQHSIEFPRLATKFGPMFDQLRAADVAEAARIRRVMASENIPTEGPSVTLFEKRLRDSREPLGFFALANTLGGFLSVCLILAVSTAVSVSRPADRGAWRRLAPWFAIIVLVGWCLLLTKSRTAWIGTATGFALLMMRTQRAKLTGPRLKLAAGAFIVLALAGWGLSRAGGLDSQVFTEAPKSLQYRLQYWTATSRMIRDHVWLGVGPGQFRWHYLFYKLPEASEEISDPHNLFLDAAANGGLAAIAGLLAMCVLLGVSFGDSAPAGHAPATPTSSLVPCVVSGVAGFAWLVQLFTGSDDRLLVLLPTTLALFWGLRRVLNSFSTDSNSCQIGCWSAAFGLLVHLCGAGGIGMPAVSLLLLALIAAAVGTPPGSKIDYGRMSIGRMGLVVATSAGLMIALFVTGLRPVAVVQAKIFAGDRLLQRSQLAGADIEYSAAVAADRWSSEPIRRRAELAYQKADAEQFRSNDSFQNAVHLLREAQSRDPSRFQDERRRGEWWIARWRRTMDVNDANEAVAAFERAWARYPTHAALMAELALALESTGSEAAASGVARQALRQDAINHERGHVDRYLGDAARNALEKIRAESIRPAELQ